MIFARQSTAIIVTVGPVLDASGVAVTDGVVGDFLISKNGAAPAALNASATLTHRNTGHYSLSLTATDVNTVGTAEVVINDTVNACPIKEITVVEPATYDVLFADAAPGPASPTNITAGTITTATNVTTVNGFAAGAITAAAIATGAIDADALAADAGTEIGTAVWATAARTLTANTNLNDPTAAAIADAVWDEAIAGHAGAGSTGEALSAAGSAGDPWGTALPGAYGAGTAGQIIGDNLNATVSSRLASASYTAPLDAAGTRSAVGLASANLDTQIADLPTNAELTTALASSDDAVLAAIAALNDFDPATDEVLANVQKINDVELIGDGSATPWGPA